MEYPNRIFVLEYDYKNILGNHHFVIVVAASDFETAKEHVKKQIGFESDPTWLMNAVYPTIYNTFGTKPEKIQAKILYNGSFHI